MFLDSYPGPHPWLGKTFQSLLEAIRTHEGRLCLTVSRPSVFSVGQGQLRVASVSESEPGTRVIFVYERYLSTAKPRKRKV